MAHQGHDARRRFLETRMINLNAKSGPVDDALRRLEKSLDKTIAKLDAIDAKKGPTSTCLSNGLRRLFSLYSTESPRKRIPGSKPSRFELN